MTNIPAADRAVRASDNEPATLPLLTTPDLISRHHGLKAKVDAMIARADKIPQLTPDQLAGQTGEQIEQTIAEATSFDRDAIALAREIEAARVEIGRPYVDVTQTVNQFFNKDHRDVLSPLKLKVGRAGGAFIGEKDRRARVVLEAQQRAAQEAERQRLEEAARLESEGRNTEAEVAMRQAEVAGTGGDQAAALAADSSVKLGRTTTAFGTATSRTTEERTIDRATVDLEALRPHLKSEAIDDAVRQWRKLNGNADLRGVTVKQVPILSSRA